MPAHAERSVLKAVKVTEAPRIDGDISDACWAQAEKVSDFYIRSDASKTPEPTTAWLCYDDKFIYLAFHCIDSQPDKVRGEQMKRGGSLNSDDWVGFDLDLYGDGRSVVWFDVSSSGTQAESLQSGNVSNIQWRGDWEAAAKRTTDGYTAEMAIPFSILQYNSDQKRMGIVFLRNHARTDAMWSAPNIGTDWDSRKFYLWDGLDLPKYSKAPLVLGYSMLGTGKNVSTRRAGFDLKHSITPQLTGLISVNPDLGSIEQQVESVDYSYGERYIPDARPFFQEGNDQFFPWSDIFYTQRITEMDAGAKLIGSMGQYNIGALHAEDFGKTNCNVIQVTRQWQEKGSALVDLVQSDTAQGGNLAQRIFGSYRFYEHGPRKMEVRSALASAGYNSGPDPGRFFGFGVSSWSKPKRLSWDISRNIIGSRFDPGIGLVNDKGIDAYAISASLADEPSKGRIGSWSIDFGAGKADYTTGKPFTRSLSLGSYCYWRSGAGVSIGGGIGTREQTDTTKPTFHDSHLNMGFWWGGQSLYRRGSVNLSVGREAGGPHVVYSIAQGWNISNKLNVRGSFEHSHINAPSEVAYSSNQLIGTLSYDVDKEHTLTGRVVSSRGRQNSYFAYRQRVRFGLDAYVIFGDPNASSTQNKLAVKLIRAL